MNTEHMTDAEFRAEQIHHIRYSEDHPADQAWILTPWDSWVANPNYSGPAVIHPEEYDENH